MSASAPPYKEQSSTINYMPSSDENPPSYASLYPDNSDGVQAVGSINSNQCVYPPSAPYPQQQYVISRDGTPLIGPTPFTVYPRQPLETTSVASLIYVGTCPLCRVGVLQDDYPLAAICCAVLFFPVGLLCCLALRQKRCSNCHYVVE